VRAAVCLTSIVLAGCSPLLGIEDPRARSDDAGPGDAAIDAAVDGTEIDAMPDAPAADFLKISLGDIRIAQQQSVKFRVQLNRAVGGPQDVTTTATFTSNNAAVALDGKGALHGVQAGTATITASLPGATSATMVVTVSSFVCHPVINEFTTGTALGGGDDELIEIYNPCVGTITVTDWTLNYRAKDAVAGADTHLLVTLDGMLAAGALRVYGGAMYTGPAVAKWAMGDGMQQNSGAIGLRDETDAPIDSVAYGDVAPTHPFIETAPMAAMANGMSASRLPYDGKDDDATGAIDGDNASDFKVIATPTPGALNTP